MGRIIAALAISLDGYAEGSGGDLGVMPLDEAFNIHNAHLIAGADRLVYGATTYRSMVSHWPQVLSDPDASDAEREIAQRCADGIPITVVSDSISMEDAGPWRGQTTIVPRAGVSAAAAAIRDGDETAVIFGSQTLVARLLREGLVDQLSMMVGPKLVAGDRPVFDAVPMTELRLRDVTRYPESENVVLEYDVLPPSSG